MQVFSIITHKNVINNTVVIPPFWLSGNASQVSDGAGAVILARRSRARELGLPVLGVVRAYSVVGVPPDVMGIGPAYAIPAVLKKAG